MTLTILAIGIVVPFGGFFEWTFTSNGSLLFDLTQSHNVLPRALSAVELFLVGHLVLCWLAVRRGWRREEIDLWLWLLTGLRRGRRRLPLLRPLLVAGAAAAVPARRARPRPLHAVDRAVLAAGVLLPTMWFWMQAWTPPARANPAPLVAEVREDTTAHQRIAVWGSFPEIYWESGRSPAGALVLSDFLVGKTADVSYGPGTLREATPGALDEYMDSLTAHPPELFIDTSTAGIRGYGHYPVRLVPQVARFLRARTTGARRRWIASALYRLLPVLRRVSARRTPR